MGRLLFLLLAICLSARAADDEALTLERIHADPPLAGQRPAAQRFSPGGRFLGWLQGSAADSQVQELWARALPDGAPRRLATAAELLGDAPATLTEAEKMALERRRINRRGITSYRWCGDDDRRLLVPIGGALFVLEPGDGAAPRVTRLPLPAPASDGPAREPQCNRAGSLVAYVRGNDLWVQGLDGSAARRLTRSGSDTLSTGLAEFIAAEEFDRFDGFWWSRDGSRLLALEVDESAVPLKSRMQIRAEGSTMTQQRYPSAGENNAKVAPLLIDVATGGVQRIALPAAAEYVVRAGWFEDGTPWLQWMNRTQTELHLVELRAAPAAPRTLWVERDEQWVDVHDDLRELPPAFGPRMLLWSSDRNGRRQLWRLSRDSGEQKPLTERAEPVGRSVCTGTAGVVFTALADRGKASELLLLDGAGRTRTLDPGPARRWRDAVGDRDCTRLLTTDSAWAQPPSHSVLSVAADRPPLALPLDPPSPLLARIAPEVQAIDFIAADGRTPLNAFYLPPLAPSSSPAGHAVIVSAYGGPTGSTVAWRWRGDVPLLAYWQRLGFGVLMFDGRGMAGRDREFTHAHYRAIGRVDVDDLFAVVRQLPQRVSGVDPKRIGFTGWSYGGFLAVRAMLDEATPLAAAVAGAPVTDQALYDTAYTERYLGLPDGGKAEPYRQANLVRRAGLLRKPLLLVHGTADDNVLFENSLQLMQALQTEGRLFETAIYPGQTHGIADRRLRLHVDRTGTDFLVRQLRP